jgi:hypothetical protein
MRKDRFFCGNVGNILEKCRENGDFHGDFTFIRKRVRERHMMILEKFGMLAARWDQKLWAAVLMGFNGDVWWCVIGYLVRICNTRYGFVYEHYEGLCKWSTPKSSKVSNGHF